MIAFLNFNLGGVGQ
ncbi:hypothetical protein OVA11_08580 [Caulobacter sp. SL161]|nr:hypothetical protein [Caulobacter sp. SL161]MCY1647102.1 hypothetical protein [Caulobacter sp. SL161]